MACCHQLSRLFTCSNPVSISLSEANISSTEKRVLQWAGDTIEFSQGGTPLVDGRLKLCNEKKIQQRELIIQTDPSTKEWGYCKGILTKGPEMVRGREAFSHKCSRTIGIKNCNPNFHKDFVILGRSCLSRQQSCSGISLEDG